MIKKILFFSPARSDFGILANVLEEFVGDQNIHVNLVITGSHLDQRFGSSKSEINASLYNKLYKIKINNLGSDKYKKIVSGLASMLSELGSVLQKVNPDFFVVLGDRQEILLAAYAALLNNTPIIHIGGGDTTYGAIDQQLRHAVSMMSDYHFVTNTEAQKLLIDMNIPQKNIFLSGSPSEKVLRSIKSNPPKKEIFLSEINANFKDKVLVCTFHPETKKISTFEDLKILIRALISLDQDKHLIIFTASNGDMEGEKFNKFIEQNVKSRENFFYFKTLGINKYLQLLSVSDLVIGNSSSGLHEAPSMNVPTLDIGDRQKGRARGDSVINVEPKRKSYYR